MSELFLRIDSKNGIQRNWCSHYRMMKPWYQWNSIYWPMQQFHDNFLITSSQSELKYPKQTFSTHTYSGCFVLFLSLHVIRHRIVRTLLLTSLSQLNYAADKFLGHVFLCFRVYQADVLQVANFVFHVQVQLFLCYFIIEGELSIVI